MDTCILEIESDCLYFTGNQKLSIAKGLRISKGVTLLTGANGSGKSTFARILEQGRNFRTNRIVSPRGNYPKIRYIEFKDIHALTGLTVGYYQQRYESSMNDDVPSVRSVVGDKCLSHRFKVLSRLFNLHSILEKKLNCLSSGELRKLLIINALIDSPDFLILDNPYIGLDAESVKSLNAALEKLRNSGQSVILVTANPDEAPDFVDSRIYADNMCISTSEPVITVNDFKRFPFAVKTLTQHQSALVEMKDCKVAYGNSVILRNVDWIIREGDRWSLTGPNGSGKSTLLSLINADNPKSYCNDIKLFGKTRGSGESIWEIKREIGYISPEMQLHFHGSGTVLQIVANGLIDTIGLYVKPDEDQKSKAKKMLEHLRISHLADRPFTSLSSGERQLVLICRSFIKEPKLLILDEPMHGLDKLNLKLVQSTIDDFLTARPDSAFIMVTHNPSELPPSITLNFSLGGDRQ